MNRSIWPSATALSALLGTGLLTLNAVAAPESGGAPAPRTGPNASAAPKIDPKTIWPAGVQALSGRYQFVQVASPGGLWARTGSNVRQVSLNELPAAFRDRLRKAELVVADLQPDGAPEVRE